MTKLSERLRDLMRIRGNLTEIELARAAELPQPTVHHILSGTTIRPRRNALNKLASALAVTVADLFSDTPVENLDDSLANRISTLPLLTWEQSIAWPQSKEEAPYLANAQHVVTDIPVSAEAFALMMKGSSMELLFPEGTLLIVDPQKTPRDRSYVVVHLQGEKEALFKQILIDGDHRYLKSLNPHLDKLEPLSFNAGDRIVGVAVQTRLNLD